MMLLIIQNFIKILHTRKIKIKRRSFFCVLFHIPLPFIILDFFQTFIQIYYFFEHFTQWVSQITGLYLWLCTFNTLLTLKILFCFICSDQLSYIICNSALLREREKKLKMIFSDKERTMKIELLRYMIVIQI